LGEPVKQFSLDSQEAAPGVGLIRIKGAMAKWDIDILGIAIEKFFAHQIYRIVIDLGETTAVASAAVGTFLSIHDRTLKQGGQLVLAAAGTGIRTIFNRLGFGDMFVFADDVALALKKFPPGKKPS
jgi:anti-anti-sigma regulatory factor